MRFMCVSKSWCDLISKDSCFILNHLQFQRAKADTDALLFFPSREQSKTKYTTIDYLSQENPTSMEEAMDSSEKAKYLFIAGHCNGLVCISDLHRVITWNPTVRRFKILPDTDDFNRQLESKAVRGYPCYVETVIGFGFVPGYEFYYKVVRMTYTYDGGAMSRPDYPSIGELYDSRTGSWRRIADEGIQRLSIKEFTYTSIFIGGSLYWLGERHKTKEEEEASGCDLPYYYPVLTALNLVDDKFPDEFELETNSGKRIAVLRESQLGLFAGDHRHRLLLTVWATKMDRVSWIKLFRINLQAEPLCFSRNGEVLLRMRYTHLVMFDPKLRDPCHSWELPYDADHAVDYVESLILLDGEKGEEEPNSVWSTGNRSGRTKWCGRTEGQVGEIEEGDFFEGGFDLFD